MIKISKYFYIHFSAILLIAICYFNRNLEIFAISYTVMVLHELAHLAAAKIIGLKISYIVLYPFGINLRLKNSIIYGISDEIILYMSGPLLNAMLALLSLPFINISSFANLFYINNIFLFLFNLLPIVPMDGGMIVKKMLAYKIGYRRAENMLRLFSIIFISTLITAEIIMIVKNYVNYSGIFVIIFLTGNLFCNKEKYHIDFLKELMFYKKKDDFKYKKVKTYIIKEKEKYTELAKNFSQDSYYVVFEENKNGEIKKIMTESQIISSLLK